MLIAGTTGGYAAGIVTRLGSVPAARHRRWPAVSATQRVATVVRRLGLDRSRVWLTGAVGVVTLTVSVAAFASPALMQVLTRNVAQMRAG